MQEMEHCVWICDDMHTADCKKLAESPEGDFRHAKLPSHVEMAVFLFGNIIDSTYLS